MWKSLKDSIEAAMYTKEQYQLANEIANTLQDTDGLPFFLSCTKIYQASFLRSTLLKVMSIPDEKIKKTRGALFTYLVNQNGKRNLD